MSNKETTTNGGSYIMPLPKNFTPEQVIAHLTAQTDFNGNYTFSGQAEQLNQFTQSLDTLGTQMGFNSREGVAVEQLRTLSNRIMMDLSSLSNANSNYNPRRMGELMGRLTTRYQNFVTQYESFKEQYPEIANGKAFTDFEENFGTATFDQGGDILDTLDMADKKYVPPVEPINLQHATADFLNLPAPQPNTLGAWYQNMVQTVSSYTEKPSVDIMDPDLSPAEILNTTTQKVAASYYRKAAESILADALKELSDEELHDVFTKLKTEQGRSFLTEDRFRNGLRDGDYSSFFSPNNWGSPINKIYSVMTEAVAKKPELVNRIVSSLNQAKIPTDPNYPLPKEEPIDQASIDALRSVWTEPEDQQLLDEAASILTKVTEPVRSYMNSFAENPLRADDSSFTKLQDKLGEKFTHQGMQTLNGGVYQNYMKPTVDDAQKGYLRYVFNDPSPEKRPQIMQPDTINALKETETPLSDITVQTLDEFAKVMDSMAFEGTPYVYDSLSRSLKPRPEENGPYICHESEEGTKAYGFWPMFQAKQQVFQAIEAKNKEQLKAAIEKYRVEEAKADQLMSLVNKEGLSKDNLFSANVNSTRSDLSWMPAKYMTDYAGHNKVNSLYNLYAPLKNTGLTIQKFIEDPVTSFEKMSEMYTAANDMDSHAKNTGSALSWASQKNYATNYIRLWEVQSTQFDRGVMGIAGIEPDPEKRNQFLAKVKLAQLNAQYAQERESQLCEAYHKIQEGESPEALEKKNLLYQHAALLPDTGENRFNLKKFVATTVDDPNWRTSLSLENELTPEKIAQMNLSELAARPQRILDQFNEATLTDHTYSTEFSKDDFLLNTYALYSRILQNAPENMRNTPGYQALQETLRTIPENITGPKSKALAGSMVKLSDIQDPFNDLQTRKTELFNFSKDSDEYTTMKESIQTVRGTIQDLRNLGTDPSISLNTLRTPGLAEQLNNAQEDTFQYIRLKSENGTKSSFRNPSGLARYNEARESLRKIHDLQDKLGLRSPAQKLYDECRMNLIDHGKNKQWLNENLAPTIAKMVYAKQYIDAKIPADRQSKNFTPEHIQEKVQNLLTHQPLGPYVLRTASSNLVKHALEEDDRFAEITQSYSEKLKQNYDTVIKEEQKKGKIKKIISGYAMDLAANQLGLRYAEDPRVHGKNPQIIEIADQIKMNPEFQETMKRLLKGKDPDLLTHPDGPDVDPAKRAKGYEAERIKLQYEKKYAEKINSILPENVKKPNTDPIRKLPAFQTMVENQLANKKPQDVQQMLNDLDKPGATQQIRENIQQIFAPAQPEAGGNQPQRQQQQPQLEQNQQVQEQPRVEQNPQHNL